MKNHNLNDYSAGDVVKLEYGSNPYGTIDTEEVFLFLTGGVLWFALISGVLLGWSI